MLSFGEFAPGSKTKMHDIITPNRIQQDVLQTVINNGKSSIGWLSTGHRLEGFLFVYLCRTKPCGQVQLDIVVKSFSWGKFHMSARVNCMIKLGSEGKFALVSKKQFGDNVLTLSACMTQTFLSFSAPMQQYYPFSNIKSWAHITEWTGETN